MESFNVSAFLLINRYAGQHDLLDTLAIAAAEVMPYVFMLVLATLWFSPEPARKKASLKAGGAVLLGLGASYAVSLFYFHPRPFAGDLGLGLLSHAPDASFPSDHTTFLFAIAFVLAIEARTRAIGAVLLGLSAMGGLARVFVGVHFPLDIAGAALFGLAAATAVQLCNDGASRPGKVLDRLASIRLPGMDR
ncbi:undecaprenyl-diphosphatase [Halomonas garicola]|uniref:undecaprenyl-diphosphatase n=1 Tax=Halomonas garicola TaxID=1690008 RepID=UPI0028A17DB1|nr:undecaprenyl-diphosphatase [Halomonas garicola]